MAISNAETMGFLDNLIQLMADNEAGLKDKGLDVRDWITETEALKDDAVRKNAEQDAMQAALKLKTREADAATELAYNTGSSRLDAIMGVLGKTSAEAKQAGKLRSSINKQYKAKKPGTPEKT